MIELFKPISGYENYLISNLGYVLNIDKKIITPALSKRSVNSNRKNDGRLKVRLNKDGKRTSYNIHKLVANHFLINYNNYPVVDHIDGDVYNNSVTNLRFVDSVANNLNTSKNRNNIQMLGIFNSNNNGYIVYLYYKSGRKYFKHFSNINDAILARDLEYNKIISNNPFDLSEFVLDLYWFGKIHSSSS